MAISECPKGRFSPKMARLFKSCCWVLFLTLILLGVPKLAGIIADSFDYGTIDPDGAFAWLFVHHLVQAGIFLIGIMVINKFTDLDFGLGWGNRKIGLRCVLMFALVFSLYVVVIFGVGILTNSLSPFIYPMEPRNIVGYLSFQLFMSGPSEELIFRAFALTMLGLVTKKRIFQGKVSLANLIAAVIFGLAHVSFSLAPLSISFTTSQVIFSIVLGLFYGDCFKKSGSVIYPMIMHSFGNVLMVGFTIVATAFMH